MSFERKPDAEPLPGYRLIEPLGSGGFGEVWKCEAPGGLFKAIKFVEGNLNALDVAGSRAEQEYHALNRIKEVRHPFVLSLERIEVASGELVIVMELADKSLHDRFEECKAAGMIGIPRNSLLRYIQDAAEALDHMIEKHKLQHLDIKPRNLFLVSERVKVADFGMVKHLGRQSGGLGGATPLYAPPETFQGNVNRNSDQYSLAIVYQELLTGQRPFTGKNGRQLALQHMQQEPELRALPEEDRPVIARALAKNPENRFGSCREFVRALRLARSTAKPAIMVGGPASKGSDKHPATMMDDGMDELTLDRWTDEERENAPKSEPSSEEISRLGLTVHQPDTGVLRPSLILGLGSFGRRALLELRCRFLDRFGDLSKLPIHQFLYIDPDPEEVRAAIRGAPEVAFSNHEVYHLPLQPMANYRRRMLDHLTDWMPREKLYAMPRSLQTQGSRALGRLAFADNHLRLLTRLRRELEQITHPEALFHSVSETGLALRDNRPRVYVIAAAGGGSSGLLTDLGYSLKRLLTQLRHLEAEVTVLLFCGAPEDPATPKGEQANVYATLTELNHFTDSETHFAAQYGADGPRVVEQGLPFNSVYLLKLTHRNPEALRDAVAHLGSYLFHELTTPLGLRLDRTRDPVLNGDAGPFHSFGTYAVWFPRGLLLRLAAQKACGRLVQEWHATGETTAQAEVEAGCARILSDPELRFEGLCASIEEATARAAEGHVATILTGILSQLENQSQQSVALDDPVGWSRQALDRVEQWLGPGLRPEGKSDWRKSFLGRVLTTGVQQVSGEWEQRLIEVASDLMEHPGKRIAAAEAAMTRFCLYCQEAVAAQRSRLDQQLHRTQQASQHLEHALEQLALGVGGFSFFGGRSRRLLRVFIDHLAAFSRQRLAEEVLGAGLHFYASLQSRLEDRIQDLSFCRQRLRHLQEGLVSGPVETGEDLNGHWMSADVTPDHSPSPSAEAYWDAIRHSETARLVLPDGETDLEHAADQFLAGVNSEQWLQLDQFLQDRVLAPLGGLHKVCMTGSDLLRSLSAPLVAEAAASLGEHLPITDVAQVEFSAAQGEPENIAARVKGYFASAAPLVAAKEGARQIAFLLVPASDAGKAFGEQSRRAVPDLELVSVPGQADLMFCREQKDLRIEDLQRLVRPCRRAYQETVSVPNVSPHARFDILDWIPLDP